MAGYIMTLGAIDDGTFDSFEGSTKQKENLMKEYALKNCVRDGIYATYIGQKSGGSYLGTRADYLGMRPGDNIYFFFNRCIYGIGEIVGIEEMLSLLIPMMNHYMILMIMINVLSFVCLRLHHSFLSKALIWMMYFHQNQMLLEC